MIPFLKMHGLGNDFVVLDARRTPEVLRLREPALARALADRRTGIGCDQLILIEPAPPAASNAAANTRDGARNEADAFMRIVNADGGEVEACGNATRCVARLLLDEIGRPGVSIETVAGRLEARAKRGGLIAVDMGEPRLDWQEIPLAFACDTLHVPLARGAVSDPAACNMGNPHVTFFVPDLAALDIGAIGPGLEHDPIFPERCNIGFAQVLDEERIRFRVWERGAGITRACGTGAAAALVNANRRGLAGRIVEVELDGGTLMMAWRADGRVEMTGPASLSFRGEFDLAAFGG
ncbi:MAG: diaminopimelate epimerase [Alphaproteobacteria bacterium]|nr:diaminopimelate epimerase [Alphaproteobacteria bacterium]